MALRSIEEEWAGFAEMVFRGMKPSPVQEVEMKKAFFAGAWALFNGVREIGEDHISESKGIRWMNAREEECQNFKKQIVCEYSEKN